METICNFRVSGQRPEFWWPETGKIDKPAMYSEENNITSLPIQLEAFESVFIIFRPNAMPEKNRLTKISLNNNPVSKNSGSKIQINNKENYLESLIFQSGAYTLITADNNERKTGMVQLPEPLQINGSWGVQFTPGWGAPSSIQFPELIPWNKHAEKGIRYFSGKATYRKKIMIPEDMLTKNQLLFLDLGEVEVIARVKLNGKDLGILWKKPYNVDVTTIVQEGENLLEVMVVNLWPNRLIGDANLPEDCNWSSETGVPANLTEYPKWMIENKPSPTGRFTFSIIKVWSKDDPLRKSGLLGPVQFYSVTRMIL